MIINHRALKSQRNVWYMQIITLFLVDFKYIFAYLVVKLTILYISIHRIVAVLLVTSNLSRGGIVKSSILSLLLNPSPHKPFNRLIEECCSVFDDELIFTGTVQFLNQLLFRDRTIYEN